MRGRRPLAAIATGVLAAVLLIAGAVALRAMATMRDQPSRDDHADGVLVGLVLPDASGTEAVRVLVYYPTGNGAGRVVNPLSRATVPGTSSSTLRDAFTFGSAPLLAAAYARAASVPTPSWVIIDPSAWDRLTGATTVSVSLPRPVDVFNGRELVSFPQGLVAVPATKVGVLLSGLDALPPGQRLDVLAQVAKGLQDAVTRDSVARLVRTDMGAGQLEGWVAGLAARGAPEPGSP